MSDVDAFLEAISKGGKPKPIVPPAETDNGVDGFLAAIGNGGKPTPVIPEPPRASVTGGNIHPVQLAAAKRAARGEDCGPLGCARFVSRVLKDAGYKHSSPSSTALYNQITKSGGKVVNDPQPGDLFFYVNGRGTGRVDHVGVVGVNSIIDAPGRSAGYKAVERKGKPRGKVVRYLRLPETQHPTQMTPQEVSEVMAKERKQVGGKPAPQPFIKTFGEGTTPPSVPPQTLAEVQARHTPSLPVDTSEMAARRKQATALGRVDPVRMTGIRTKPPVEKLGRTLQGAGTMIGMMGFGIGGPALGAVGGIIGQQVQHPVEAEERLITKLRDLQAAGEAPAGPQMADPKTPLGQKQAARVVELKALLDGYQQHLDRQYGEKTSFIRESASQTPYDENLNAEFAKTYAEIGKRWSWPEFGIYLSSIGKQKLSRFDTQALTAGLYARRLGWAEEPKERSLREKEAAAIITSELFGAAGSKLLASRFPALNAVPAGAKTFAGKVGQEAVSLGGGRLQNILSNASYEGLKATWEKEDPKVQDVLAAVVNGAVMGKLVDAGFRLSPEVVRSLWRTARSTKSVQAVEKVLAEMGRDPDVPVGKGLTKTETEALPTAPTPPPAQLPRGTGTGARGPLKAPPTFEPAPVPEVTAPTTVAPKKSKFDLYDEGIAPPSRPPGTPVEATPAPESKPIGKFKPIQKTSGTPDPVKEKQPGDMSWDEWIKKSGTGQPIQKPSGTLEKAAEQAKSRIEARKKDPSKRGGGLGSTGGFDLEDLTDHAIVGANKLQKGLTDFKQWAKEMISEFGEQIRPNLRRIYRAAQAQLERRSGDATRKTNDGYTLTRSREKTVVKDNGRNIRVLHEVKAPNGEKGTLVLYHQGDGEGAILWEGSPQLGRKVFEDKTFRGVFSALRELNPEVTKIVTEHKNSPTGLPVIRDFAEHGMKEVDIEDLDVMGQTLFKAVNTVSALKTPKVYVSRDGRVLKAPHKVDQIPSQNDYLDFGGYVGILRGNVKVENPNGDAIIDEITRVISDPVFQRLSAAYTDEKLERISRGMFALQNIAQGIGPKDFKPDQYMFFVDSMRRAMPDAFEKHIDDLREGNIFAIGAKRPALIATNMERLTDAQWAVLDDLGENANLPLYVEPNEWEVPTWANTSGKPAPVPWERAAAQMRNAERTATRLTRKRRQEGTFDEDTEFAPAHWTTVSEKESFVRDVPVREREKVGTTQPKRETVARKILHKLDAFEKKLDANKPRHGLQSSTGVPDPEWVEYYAKKAAVRVAQGVVKSADDLITHFPEHVEWLKSNLDTVWTQAKIHYDNLWGSDPEAARWPGTEQPKPTPSKKTEKSTSTRVKPTTSPKPEKPAAVAPARPTAPTVKETPKELPSPEKATGLANQVLEREVEASIIPRLPEKGRPRSAQELQARGEALLKAGTHDPEKIAREIADGVRGVTADDAALLLAHRVKLGNDLNAARKDYSDAVEKGSPRAEHLQKEAQKAEDRLMEFLDNVQKGPKVEWHNIGMAFQAGTEFDSGNFASVLQYARQKAKRDVTKREGDVLGRFSKEISDRDEQIVEVEKKVKEAEAKQGAVQSARQGRARKREDLLKERTSLLDTLKQLFKGGPKAAPKGGPGMRSGSVIQYDVASMAKTVYLLTKNTFELGANSVEDAVKSVIEDMDSIGIRITRDEVLDAFVEANRKSAPTRTALQQEVESLKRQARREVVLRKQIERLKSGNVSTSPAKAKTTNATIEQMEGELRELRRKRGVQDQIENLEQEIARLEGGGEPKERQTRVIDPQVKELQQRKRDLEAEYHLNKQIEALQKKLETGDYTRETREVRELTQRLKDLRAERNLLDRDLRRKIAEMEPKNLALKIVQEVGSGLRQFKLGGDVGTLTRQGLYTWGSHPIISTKALGKALKASVSERNMEKIEAEYRNREINGRKAKLIRHEAGLQISDILTNPEELAVARFLSRIGFGGLDRFQHTFINSVRADVFDQAVEAGLNAQELKSVAKFINAATGRSSAKQIPELLQLILTAPRYERSRWEMLWEPIRNVSNLGTTAIREQRLDRASLRNLKDMGAAAASILSLYFLAEKFQNYEVTWDPDHSDFLKMRHYKYEMVDESYRKDDGSYGVRKKREKVYDDKVWDPTAGIAPRLRDVVRAVLIFRDPSNMANWSDLIGKGMVRTFSPAVRTTTGEASLAYQRSQGVQKPKDPWVGFEIDEGEAHGLMAFMPIIVNSVEQSLRLEKPEDKVRETVDVGVKEFVGQSVNRYPRKKDPKRKGVVQFVEDKTRQLTGAGR